MVLKTYHNHCVKVHGPIQMEVRKTKYSIYFISYRGWRLSHVLESATYFESCLEYGWQGKSPISAHKDPKAIESIQHTMA